MRDGTDNGGLAQGLHGIEGAARRMRVLDRLGAWATTGIGSLPHHDARSATEHAIDAYGLPFCPQLPRRDGDMVSEWLGGDPARCGWSRERDRRRPEAWDALLATLALRPPTARVVKLQVTGPVTLARALGGRGPDATALAGEIATWLAANVAEQVATLADRGLDAVLVVDEPSLTAADDPRVWDPLRAVAPAWGLHLCCAVPWAPVASAAPDLLSLDLTLGLDDDGAEVVRRLAADGSRIAWGVLAPHRPELDAGAGARLADAVARTGVSGDRSLLTPTCGSGLVTVAREVAMAALLEELAGASSSIVRRSA